MKECEVAIVGGGMVGSALGYGLAKLGVDTVILDQGDNALRAARGNFGLLWVQGKGADFKPYSDWTLLSAYLWPSFAKEITSLTGIDIQFEQKGGIHFCLDEEELNEYAIELEQQAAISNGKFKYQMLNTEELKKFEPNIGSTIPGGGYSPNDGHVNPLLLLRAMHAGFIAYRGSYRPNRSVQSISKTSDGFCLQTDQGELSARKVVLAAGLDNKRLAPMLNLNQPLHPQRGQILITERLPQLLNYPSIYLRQTHEGTIQIGDSCEDADLDDSNTAMVMAQLSKRAIRVLPALQHRRIVRGWGALRILSPDGYPIYEQSNGCGSHAFAFSCHSGVTLAAAHALKLAPMIVSGKLDDSVSPFSPLRFEG